MLSAHRVRRRGIRRVRLGSGVWGGVNEKFTLGVQGLLGDGAVWVGE